MNSLCFQIEPFHAASYQGALDGLEARFTNFWAGLSYPARIIARTRRHSFAPIRQAMRKRSAPLDDIRELMPLLESALTDPNGPPHVQKRLGHWQGRAANAAPCTPSLAELNTKVAAVHEGMFDTATLTTLLTECRQVVWPWRWLKNYARMYHILEESAPPLTIDHYFVCWPDATINPEGIHHALKHTFVVPNVTPAPLPPLFHGLYHEEATYLAADEPGLPYLTVLTGWDVRGEWDLLSLNHLLMNDYELAIAIDIQTLPGAKAQRRTTDAYMVLREAVAGRSAVKDARSERAYVAADYALSQLDQQSLHEVAYAVLLQAPTLSSLERRIQSVRDDLGARLRLDRVVGAQAEYLKFFTPLPASAITVPIVRRNTLSHGVAVKTPWGIRKTDRTVGALWGYDPHEAMPIHYEPWGEQGVENAHLLLVGASGSGKTVFLLTQALRQAVQGNQIVFFDPVDRGRWLCDAVAGGARYYDVQTDAAINILDPLTHDLSRQLDHVVRKLSIILGRSVDEGGRWAFLPRHLDNFEVGAIDQALQSPHVYGRKGERLQELTSWNTAAVPLLEDLVMTLRQIAAERELPAAATLASEIELLLLGSKADLFNRPTQLRWDFRSDVVAYNFKHADRSLLPLYYDHSFEALNRWVRSSERRLRRQPLITILDEYYYMASVKALEAYVALATKTWRNYGAAMWTADQNATTYFGQEGLPAQWGPFTANNCLIKIFFRQEANEADILARAYRDQLGPDRIRFIKTAGTGECIALFGNEVHHLVIQLTDLEAAYFLR